MSYNNFKATIVSAKIQHELYKECTLVNGCTTEFEGEAKQGGTVKINIAGRPTIKDYTGAAIDAAEEVTANTTLLQIDQANYFNFKIKDIDKAMMTGNLFDAQTEEAKQGLAEKMDAYVGTMAKNAGKIIASTQITSAADAVAKLEAALIQLRKNDVGRKTQVFADVPWWFYYLVLERAIDLDTNNSSLVKEGVLKQYKDVYLRPTNMLYNDNTDDYIMVRTKKAIGFASGLDEVEAYRPESDFSDALKGLNVYGAKVIRPKELVTIKVHE